MHLNHTKTEPWSDVSWNLFVQIQNNLFCSVKLTNDFNHDNVCSAGHGTDGHDVSDHDGHDFSDHDGHDVSDHDGHDVSDHHGHDFSDHCFVGHDVSDHCFVSHDGFVLFPAGRNVCLL